MDLLELYRNDIRLAAYELGGAAIEIGRASGCDVVLDAPEIAPRHWLAMRRRGVVALLDVSRGKRRVSRELPLPSNRALEFAPNHSIVWIPRDEAARTSEPRTDAVGAVRRESARFSLVIGRGPDAKRVRVGEQPVHLGRCADNDIVFHDTTVSESHLRLEPCESGLLLRDLASRNGTWVNSVRVHMAVLTEGAHVRLGRSDFRVVAASYGQTDGPTMVAESSSMLHVLGDVQRMAQLAWPVLVVGESGTGKEGIAVALHEAGPRKSQPLVAVNAGGLPRELVESELFGHEKGAFTGAATVHKGVFEQAHGGTLFLDEIGELPLSLQARLLRVLETGELRRVGAEHARVVDVRLVCATHRDLLAMVEAGSFRRDLYFRIARLVLEVPALRFRPDDLRALCGHFLRQVEDEVGHHVLSAEAVSLLLTHDWPGNARELRNVLCAAAATAGDCIEVHDIEPALRRISGFGAGAFSNADAVLQAVHNHGGNQAAAARALGIARSTLRDRLRKPGAGAA